jgi:hypothetical protein
VSASFGRPEATIERDKYIPISFASPLWVSTGGTAMAVWGVVPPLSHIIRIAACPTCYNLDIARRPRNEFLPSLPGFNGSFWIFDISLKDAVLSENAGCQFCQVLSIIFRRVLIRSPNAFDSLDGSVTIAIPFTESTDEQFHVTFRYFAPQPGITPAQERSKRFFLTTIQKRIITISKLT